LKRTIYRFSLQVHQRANSSPGLKIAHPHMPSFESLLFIDRQKEELKRNTLQFVKAILPTMPSFGETGAPESPPL
jgi:predicted AAA+ superfamily ATPase